MGFGGISIGSLLLVMVIVVLLFGTKKLRNMGTDLGGAIKGFKTAMKEEQNAPEQQLEDQGNQGGETIDVKPEKNTTGTS